MENLHEDHLTNMDLQVDGPIRQYLTDTAKWAKFISIVVFIACGFILLFGIIGSDALGNTLKKLGGTYDRLGDMSGTFFMIAIVLIAGILGFVYYFLFNFSKKVKAALLSENTAELNTGLKSLKTFFIITTVFAILALLNSIYAMF